MIPYKNLDGDSGIAAFEAELDSIKVKFRDGSVYLYNHNVPGPKHVSEMKRLAELGEGLNSYINRYVRKSYAKKLQ